MFLRKGKVEIGNSGLNNDGSSTKNDGAAPVRVVDYYRGRVADMTGQVDQAEVRQILRG